MKFAAISAVLFATSTVAVSAFAHGPGRGPGHLDTNQDGKVTLAESRAAGAEFFKKLDTNGDGVVTQAEAEAARAKMGDKMKEHADERFAKKDTNKNGKLERSEVARMPDEKFKAIDTNKDGALSKEELKAGFAAHHGEHGAKGEGHDMFSAADTNKDGKLTAAEVQAAGDARFKKMDKNGDGVITKDEMPEHRGHGGKGDGKSACGPKKDGKTSSSRPA